MARTQFKVTFTNAQPGAPVSVLMPSVEHVYSSATAVKPVGGKQLYLDATNSITVWSDAQDVIAQTVDGAGLFIQGTATVASPTVTVGDGTAPTNPAGSAASSAIDHVHVEATGTVTGSSAGFTIVGGWTVDDSAGSGTITADADGRRWNLAPGVYWIQAFAGASANIAQLIFQGSTYQADGSGNFSGMFGVKAGGGWVGVLLTDVAGGYVGLDIFRMGDSAAPNP